MLFETSYSVDAGNQKETYWTTLFAKNREDAIEVIAKRNLNENLQAGPCYHRPDLCSELLAAGNIPRAMHAGCWLSMLAVSSGVVKPLDLLHDRGVLHEIAHHVDLGINAPETLLRNERTITRLIAEVEALEKLVPGMWPADETDFSRKPKEINIKPEPFKAIITFPNSDVIFNPKIASGRIEVSGDLTFDYPSKVLENVFENGFLKFTDFV